MKKGIDYLMKNKWLLYSLISLVAVLLFVFTDDAGIASLAFAVTPIPGGGTSVSGEGLDTTITNANAPGLILTDIDRLVLKMRPSATPIEQISRSLGAKAANSRTVEHYAVDTLPTTTKVKTATAIVAPASISPTVAIDISDFDIVEATDTLLVEGVKGFDKYGKSTNEDIVLCVSEKDSTARKIVCFAVNGSISEGKVGGIPVIPANTPLHIMGRAAGETDIQTAPFETLPEKRTNYCQTFSLQVEQSTIQKMEKNKEVEWTLADIEENAAYKMRETMEKSFLFGAGRKVVHPKTKKETYFTGGIWYQAAKEHEYSGQMTVEELIDIMKESYTGTSANGRKVLVGGSDFIANLNKIKIDKYIGAKETKVEWGIEFETIRTNFGSAYTKYAYIFDAMNMSGCGLLFDPQYIEKKTFMPFERKQLDLKTSGQRDTDAVVLREISTLVLKYPKCHMRIVPAKSAV